MPRRHSFRHPVPTPASPLFGPTPPAWPLARPLPLLPLALSDVGYALYHVVRSAQRRGGGAQVPVPVHLLTALACVRACVLALVVVPSPRWRTRGPYVVAASGASILACTWEACAAQLMRKTPDPHPVSGVYLAITCAISIFEYIFFLVLVRLVPPPHPFTMRGPPTAIPTSASHADALSPSSFAPLPLSPSLTPAGVGGRRRSHSANNPQGHALFSTPQSARGMHAKGNAGAGHGPSMLASPGAGYSYGYSPWSHRGDESILEEYDEADQANEAAAAYDDDDDTTAQEEEDDDEGLSDYGSFRAPRLGTSRFDAEMGLTSSDLDGDGDLDGDDEEGYDSDGSYSHSSVSESSIIDLPRPRLQPIVAEGAIAEITVGVAGAVDELARAGGELVRRSASARLLGRSAGSEEAHHVGGGSSATAAAAAAAGLGVGNGYGTFGRG